MTGKINTYNVQNGEVPAPPVGKAPKRTSTGRKKHGYMTARMNGFIRSIAICFTCVSVPENDFASNCAASLLHHMRLIERVHRRSEAINNLQYADVNNLVSASLQPPCQQYWFTRGHTELHTCVLVYAAMRTLTTRVHVTAAAVSYCDAFDQL